MSRSSSSLSVFKSILDIHLNCPKPSSFGRSSFDRMPLMAFDIPRLPNVATSIACRSSRRSIVVFNGFTVNITVNMIYIICSFGTFQLCATRFPFNRAGFVGNRGVGAAGFRFAVGASGGFTASVHPKLLDYPVSGPVGQELPDNSLELLDCGRGIYGVDAGAQSKAHVEFQPFFGHFFVQDCKQDSRVFVHYVTMFGGALICLP